MREGKTPLTDGKIDSLVGCDMSLAALELTKHASSLESLLTDAVAYVALPTVATTDEEILRRREIQESILARYRALTRKEQP